MLKSLFKFLIVIMILVFLVPLVMLLFGEGFAISKIFQFANRYGGNRTEYFDDSPSSSTNISISDGDDVTVVTNGAENGMGHVIVLRDFSLHHNITIEDENHMDAKVECQVVNMTGDKIQCIVRFYDGDLKLIRHKAADKYSSKEGYLVTHTTFTPTAKNQIFNGDLYIPYFLFPTKESGKTYFAADVIFVDSKGNILYESEKTPFYLNK